MEWRDLEVWRRQRPYITAELRKDAPEHATRLGLATSFALVVGMMEGARLSALKGDLRFPLRYALYNIIPSFVGGKVPPSSVASAMATAPPLRSCPRATAQATNLRALRTAVAGCTVLSIMFQVTLAGGRGTEAYELAVAEGREVPSILPSGPGNARSIAGGVVRLCGARGLGPALVAARREGRHTSILPVVIASGALGPERLGSTSASLPDESRAAVAKSSPRPCYFRIDAGRLFSREAWQPVMSELADAASSSNGLKIVLVVEADTLSSDVPQALLVSPAAAAAAAAAGGVGGGVMREGAGDLDADQARWGLAMLRRELEDEEQGAGLTGVLLAGTRLGGFEGSTVSIDARAALLLSVLSWAQQCAAEAVVKEEGASVDMSLSGEAVAAEAVMAPSAQGDGVPSKPAQAVEPENAVADGWDGAVPEESIADAGAERVKEGEGVALENGEPVDTATSVLGVLERTGRGLRKAVLASDGRLRSAVTRTLVSVSGWVERRTRVGNGKQESQVLLYDTDDDSSFDWLSAQMQRQGWTVRRFSGRDVSTVSAAPVLVHRCSDEKTMTAAAGHLVHDAEGPPVCVVVHRWDCGVEARRLLPGARAASVVLGGRRGSAEVICTAEVGEDLLQFVRTQLQSGATPDHVQEVLDGLFAGFSEASQDGSA